MYIPVVLALPDVAVLLRRNRHPDDAARLVIRTGLSPSHRGFKYTSALGGSRLKRGAPVAYAGRFVLCPFGGVNQYKPFKLPPAPGSRRGNMLCGMTVIRTAAKSTKVRNLKTNLFIMPLIRFSFSL